MMKRDGRVRTTVTTAQSIVSCVRTLTVFMCNAAAAKVEETKVFVGKKRNH